MSFFTIFRISECNLQFESLNDNLFLIRKLIKIKFERAVIFSMDFNQRAETIITTVICKISLILTDVIGVKSTNFIRRVYASAFILKVVHDGFTFCQDLYPRNKQILILV